MEFSEVSLAARVCSDEPGLAYSRQAALFQAIDRYEQDSIGILLLILCLFIWINSVISDASGALRMIAAVRTHMHVYLEDVCTFVHACRQCSSRGNAQRSALWEEARGT